MAKKEKEQKTNAMRILEKEQIPFTHLSYTCTDFVDGVQTADALGLPHGQVYKTLVAVGSDREHYVFVIPIAEELDLKKCAVSVGVKSVELIHVKDLFALTGYVRGGCTAIGMKKAFVTRIDVSAEKQAEIYVSAGKVGAQIRLSPRDLARAAKAEFADLTAGSGASSPE
ncbi:MAG: Cys-tRNA(Pro) deacylase [Lachnospiraceae bacterium]|jgi:Cys-tRNA(Pro)/Cys-tRNA(Cys) deacylase|nr:Cys-tRNA(Pro) deacylase [Lachnospiraceae bacterium]